MTGFEEEHGIVVNVRKFATYFFLATLLAGCTAESETVTPSPTSVNSVSASPVPSETAESNQVILYFASDTGKSIRLYSESVSIPNFSGDLASDVLSALLTGIKPVDPDYVNLWGENSRLNGVTILNGLATVDLGFGQLNFGAESELRAIEQILWTLKANIPEITQVEFLRDGNIVESFAGHVDTMNVFELDEGYQALATIDLDLDEGDVVKSGEPVTGLACTFEANAPWELFQDGSLIGSGAEVAEMACPVRSKFQINLGELKPGKYSLRVWESSMEDGSLINEDTKTFMIE